MLETHLSEFLLPRGPIRLLKAAGNATISFTLNVRVKDHFEKHRSEPIPCQRGTLGCMQYCNVTRKIANTAIPYQKSMKY